MFQTGLFDAQPSETSVPGLRYETGFLAPQEEAALIEVLCSLPLRAARYKAYLARRRVMGFGSSYDFDTQQLRPGPPLDPRLEGLRTRVAHWAGTTPERLGHALVAEYAPGTPLGWHRDVPDFERIVGVSLGGEATLGFRPYPPDRAAVGLVRRLVVAPRSIYLLSGQARWAWQHCVQPTVGLRWSITFRDQRLRWPRMGPGTEVGPPAR